MPQVPSRVTHMVSVNAITTVHGLRCGRFKHKTYWGRTSWQYNHTVLLETDSVQHIIFSGVCFQLFFSLRKLFRFSENAQYVRGLGQFAQSVPNITAGFRSGN